MKTFNVGDKVRVIDKEEYYYGKVGTYALHDGCSEGSFPHHVDFDGGEDCFNSKDLELVERVKPIDYPVIGSALHITNFSQKAMDFIKGLLDPEKQLLTKYGVVTDSGIDFNNVLVSRAVLSQKGSETLYKAVVRETEAQEALDRKAKK